MKRKILLVSVGPVFLMGLVIILLTVTRVKGQMQNDVKESLQGIAMAVDAFYNQKPGDYIEKKNGMWKGVYELINSEALEL